MAAYSAAIWYLKLQEKHTGLKEPLQKHLVVIFSCRSCRTILVWGHEIACLFHGREIER